MWPNVFIIIPEFLDSRRRSNCRVLSRSGAHLGRGHIVEGGREEELSVCVNSGDHKQKEVCKWEDCKLKPFVAMPEAGVLLVEIWGSGFRIWSLEFRDQGLRVRVWRVVLMIWQGRAEGTEGAEGLDVEVLPVLEQRRPDRVVGVAQEAEVAKEVYSLDEG